MRASIIIVSYNSQTDLPACLDAAVGQAQANDEIIVVDNGSQDASAALVRRDYPTVRLLENMNSGYAGGNNLGASAAQGEYLVFLNPDTMMAAGALAALLEPLDQSASIGMTTACLVHRANPQLVNTCGNTMHYTGLTFCRGANQPVDRYRESCDVDAVSGAAFAVRRSLFEQLGGFDEAFFMYVEDSEFSLRARLAGFRCRYVATALVHHDYAMAYSPAKAFYLDRNRYLMLLKNIDATTLRQLIPGLLLGELVTWGYLLLKGPAYWGVKWRVYRNIWHQRRVLARPAPRQGRGDSDLISTLTYRLEFGQMTNRRLALIAGIIFHPTFRLARLMVRGAR